MSLKEVVKNTLRYFGLALIRVRKENRSGINLNVGCGQYEINGFVSVDFFSEHYYGKVKNGFKRVHYDMRNDDLPFESNVVDNVYCSHVIEHIESKYVEQFFSEVHRVLKDDGVFRIACPDSLFLYEQMIRHPRYFCWHPMYSERDDAVRCFVSLVATHRSNLPNFGIKESLKELPYSELRKTLRERGEFDIENPGRHINNWDFIRLESLAKKVGFSEIVESKFQGSSSPVMQGRDMDLTHPGMSLYFECTKTR